MIRIIIVDDHNLVRAGLCRLLNSEHDIEVVAETPSGYEAVSLCEQLEPDVVLLDFNLPDIDGLEITERIFKNKIKTKILILTMYENEEYAIRLIQAGASGYILKQISPNELLEAVRTVAQNNTYVTRNIQEKIIERLGQKHKKTPESILSNREIQVLIRIAAGTATRRIAEELCLSISTIETYRSRILDKLNLRNNSDITRFAIRRSLIEAN